MTQDQIPITPDDAKRMIRAVQNLHDETARIINEHAQKPHVGSQASSELDDYTETQAVNDAYIQASLLIEGVADHLSAFVKSLTEPACTIAPWTCVRAELESAAIASWLITPNANAHLRVQRSFAFRYEGLNQQRKFAIAAGKTNEAHAVETRIDKIDQDAQRLGFAPVLDRKGRRIGVGQQMPTITQLIADTFNEEPTFRLISAVAHAHTWAIHQVGFRRADSIEELLLEKHLDLTYVHIMCIQVATYFSQPIWYKSQLFGWPTMELRQIINSTFVELRSKWNEPV